MGNKTAVNPRRIPRTQADVDRAYTDGIKDGSRIASVIMMSALLDKFGLDEQIPDVWAAFEKLSKEVIERRVTVADLRTTLREEYDLEI